MIGYDAHAIEPVLAELAAKTPHVMPYLPLLREELPMQEKVLPLLRRVYDGLQACVAPMPSSASHKTIGEVLAAASESREEFLPQPALATSSSYR